MLPEKAQYGITGRRIRKALVSPSLLVRNLKFWWNEDVSEERHLFVMGPPRSGTTLIKNVLQSHSEICGIEGETFFFLRENYSDFRRPSVDDQRMKQIIRRSKSDVDLFDRFAAIVKDKKDGKRFLEKTPEHAIRLEYILDHFPASQAIFVIRDPRDGLSSARKYEAYWNSLPDGDRVGGYIETWRESVKKYLDNRGNTAVSLVCYEDFCREPEQALQRLADDLGIQVEPQQLDPSYYSQTWYSNEQSHSRLKEPITAQTVGRWKQELTGEDFSRVEEELGHEMKSLGYTLES